MIHVYFDGVPQDDADFDGLKEFKIRGTMDNGTVTKEISSEFKVRGAAFAVLQSTFINNASGTINTIAVTFVDDCCGYTWDGTMQFEGIRWCEGDCFCTCRTVEDDQQLTCFRSTTIADNWNGFQDRVDHPKMVYCNELRPGWMHEVILIFAAIMFVILDVLYAVVAVIQGIIDVVCLIIDAIAGLFGGGGCPDSIEGDSILSAYNDWIGHLEDQILGCGRRHPSPLVRDYIKNVCGKCGLSFESPILNDPHSDYYHSVLINAETKKGCYTCNWIPDNEPLLLGDELMDKLNVVFNARYVVKNNTLIFKRKDKFKDDTPTYDLTDPARKASICYENTGTRKPAYGQYEYQRDPIEYIGNEARTRFNDIIDYNQPTINPAFMGKRRVEFEFGAVRWRRDGIEKDVIGAYQAFPNFTASSQKYWHAMLMAQHTALNMRLVIYDPDQGTDPAFAQTWSRPAGYTDFYDEDFTTDGLLYNYPYFVDADFNDTHPNLYAFHKIDDSRLTSVQNLRFTAVFDYLCADLPLIDVFVTVNTPRGIGTVEQYEIDFNTKALTLEGTL